VLGAQLAQLCRGTQRIRHYVIVNGDEVVKERKRGRERRAKEREVKAWEI
jgi:hypothetical protein